MLVMLGFALIAIHSASAENLKNLKPNLALNQIAADTLISVKLSDEILNEKLVQYGSQEYAASIQFVNGKASLKEVTLTQDVQSGSTYLNRPDESSFHVRSFCVLNLSQNQARFSSHLNLKVVYSDRIESKANEKLTRALIDVLVYDENLTEIGTGTLDCEAGLGMIFSDSNGLQVKNLLKILGMN